MPASAGRIGFVLESFRRATSTTPSVQTTFGNLARESEDPIETFFDDVDDAQIVAAQRQALLSVSRRRFRITTRDIDETLDLAISPIAPMARFIDSEKDANLPVLICDIAYDLGKDAAAFTLWG